MRKTLFFSFLFVLLMVLCTAALAWYCPGCGKSNDLNFCNQCGTAKPAANACSACRYSPVNGSFCPNCGKPQSGNPWPDVTLSMVQVYFHPSGDNRVQSYCGPGDFPGAGAYKTMKMSSTYALFTDGNYTLIDMDYMTVGHRRVYFRKSAYPKDRYTIPTFDYTAYPAVTTASVTPMWGPGSDYDQFTEAQISSGTYLDVFFEEDGYVFAEFQCNLGRVRAWINVNQVRAQ